MTYFCLIETGTSQVPYLEVLPAATLDAARDEARRLLREHRKSIAAHIFQDDERLATILTDNAAGAPTRLRHGPPRSRPQPK